MRENRLSREEFNLRMEKSIDEWVSQFEENIKKKYLFTPEYKTTTGTIGDGLKVARFAYAEAIKGVIRTSIWMKEE